MDDVQDDSVTPRRGLQCGSRWLDLSLPAVMGILNVTPDSFSDGGRLSGSSDAAQFQISLDKTLTVASSMIDAGAVILDVGGESTRPGAVQVSEQEELDRVLPVVEALQAEFDVIVSVDTSTPALMRAAASAGAGMINDIRALQRTGAVQAAADTDMAVCLMHMQGEPGTMQQNPQYQDVVAEVRSFLEQRVDICRAAGIGGQRICIDPGFGFGKTPAHNYRLLARLSDFAATGLPVLAGMSRKSMIGNIIGKSVDERLAGSLAAAVLSVINGANIVRVHDVAETVDALRIVETMQHYC
ncbi:dihydropteroate synthase [Pseudohongiella spirulinae]|uniref:Dihydropteroate synthase n=1 Tax=Pseudohongiella spirulinae TaxID=1249552 RepID=A0A0S2KH45_9GAMM|nr:dihydropteroate synthase [Pseudohongiella spirulinae]ALO47295.1 Dihydropteroate synthase [Pseudohongiella spirulinae]